MIHKADILEFLRGCSSSTIRNREYDIAEELVRKIRGGAVCQRFTLDHLIYAVFRNNGVNTSFDVVKETVFRLRRFIYETCSERNYNFERAYTQNEVNKEENVRPVAIKLTRTQMKEILWRRNDLRETRTQIARYLGVSDVTAGVLLKAVIAIKKYEEFPTEQGREEYENLKRCRLIEV